MSQHDELYDVGVTIVVTDIDDELPAFSRSESSVPVPEDVGK